MANYQSVIDALAAKGIRAEFHRPDQLVISTGEQLAIGRIWIMWRNRWFISTWAPAIYAVPDTVDVVSICFACLSWAPDSFHTIPDPITQRFGLCRLEERDVDELLSACSDGV